MPGPTYAKCSAHAARTSPTNTSGTPGSAGSTRPTSPASTHSAAPSQSSVTPTARTLADGAPRTPIPRRRASCYDLAMPLLLGEIVRRHARWRPDRQAYVIGPHRVTYRQLNALANRFAHGLRALGVGHGDRVATL